MKSQIKKTAGILLMGALALTSLSVNAAPRGEQTRTLTEVKPKCGIKVTIVAFESTEARQVSYCTFSGEITGRAEFVAGCSETFRVDGIEYAIAGQPDMFGIVVMNLDDLQPVETASVVTSVSAMGGK